MNVCRSCDAPIRWVKTATGRSMPIDPKPTQDGNLVIVDGVAKIYKPGEDGALFAPEKFLSHFASCPNAPAWRRP